MARKNLIASAILVCAFLTTNAFAADTNSFEARLNQLEKTVQALQAENKDLKTQLGWDGKSPIVNAKPAGKESKLIIGGFIQGQAEFGDSPDARFSGTKDRFFLRRARVNFSGEFAEHFDYKIEADFGANTSGAKSGFAGVLTDVYVNWNRYPFANVKLGQFKTPFGYEQLVSDTKLLTIERSLGNDRLTDGRQIGLGVSGDFFQKRLSYSVGMFNGTGVNISSNDNGAFMYAGRITGVPVLAKIGGKDFRWSLGLDGLFTRDHSVSKSGFGFDSVPGGSKDNIFAGSRSSWGVDSQFSWGPFGLEGEYLHSCFEPTDNLPAKQFDAEGWYVMGTWFVLPKKLMLLMKYESFDPNLSAKNDVTDIYTFGAVYYIKGDDLKLCLNYLLGSTEGGLQDQGRLLARFQVVF